MHEVDSKKMGRIWVWCRAFFVKSSHFCGSVFGTGFVGDGHTATQHPAHSTAQRISFFFGYGDGLLIAKGQEHTYGL
jgi:hypothetical protein